MTKHELENRYFNWMYQLVYDSRYSKHLSHKKLLAYLNEVEFTYILGMDSNRAEDGTDLRYCFAYENDIDEHLIATYLDIKPCSILEMMIALSKRCEEHIMSNPDIGNRTGQWFWNMIVNLGLGSMSDKRFDLKYVDEVIDRFLNRHYNRDGKGGLFVIPNCTHDMRTAEIWYQAMWYLDYILKN